MDPSERLKYLREVRKLVQSGFDLNIPSSQIAEMITDQVIKDAIDSERQDWIQMAYAEYGELIQ